MRLGRSALPLALAVCALWLAPGALASSTHAASWCGSGENTSDLADANTGYQFHVIYAVPADGQDNFATWANRISDDVASIDSWWVSQDSTRELRFDTAQFPGGTCLDISFLRLTVAGAQLAGDASSAFDAVANGINASPLADGPGVADKDDLVYYDGPAPESDVCGTGNGDFDQGGGLAVVWVQACPEVPTDTVAAHEALHALGALPAGAPHADPAHPGHPDDSPLDVLYWSNPGLPLSQLYLDWGHDDYYGHAPGWDDIKDTPFMHRVDVPQVPLAVALAGAGSVSADEPGLVCAATCTTQWDPGSQIVLTATPSPTTRFVGWRGACSGPASCMLTLAQAQSVIAVFGPKTVPVRTSVAGRGRVVCTPACSATFAAGTPLTLRAVPGVGWKFVRWSGSCSGTRSVCRPATGAAVSAHATFAKLPKRAKRR